MTTVLRTRGPTARAASAADARRWADADTIQCTRTPGGHRRFRRVVLERYLESKEQADEDAQRGGRELTPMEALEEEGVAIEAMMRRQWHEPFVEAEVVGRMRELGQRLLGLLIQYLTRQEEDERFAPRGRDRSGIRPLQPHRDHLDARVRGPSQQVPARSIRSG